MFRLSCRLAGCVLSGVAFFFSLPVSSQQSSQTLRDQVAQPVLQGQVKPSYALPSNQRMHFSLVLPLRNEPQLNELLSRLSDPASPEYRHFLSVGDFTDRFGPSEADYRTVVDYALANGFVVDPLPANRMVVPLSGTVDQIQRALHVRMNAYPHPTENRTFFSPDRDPSLQLAVPILRVAGLDNFNLPKSMMTKGQAARAGIHAAVKGTGPDDSYAGSDMRAAYYGGSPLTGAGQTLALFQLDGYFQSDLDLTFSSEGQSYSAPVVNVLLDGADGTPALTGDDGEQVMDIAQAISMAPGLDQVRVYIGAIPIDVLNAIASDGVAKQVSISWAWQMAEQGADDQAFKELAAQGQNVFVASGDYGAFDSGYKWAFPSEDPWVTAVGGTTLATRGEDGEWVSETAWSRSGGGVSLDKYPQPAWQAGTATPANGGSTSLRNVPDVAMEADFDNFACDMGACTGTWAGTSFAAPRWAGFLALVNEQAAEAGDRPLGFINQALYDMGKKEDAPFHDVTTGSNPSTTDPVTSFQAVAGDDLVTGWGSPAGPAFIDALAPWSRPGFQLAAASTSLSINPGDSGTLRIGIVTHGGFTGAVNLSVAGLPSGVTASWSGNPVSDASVLTLTAASELPRGQYRISLSGASGSLSANTNFTLLVNAPGFSITALPMNFAVYGGTSYSVELTVTGFAGFTDPVSFAIGSTLPKGISAVFKTGGAGPAMLTLNAAKDATPGLYDMTILATAGKTTASTMVEMRVLQPGFLISVTPVPTAIAQGGMFTGNVSLVPLGPFDGSLSLQAFATPPGVTASFNPASITVQQASQVTLTASGSAPLGTGWLSFGGSIPGFGSSFAGYVDVIATMTPGFKLTTSPAFLTIPQGGSASTTITVNPGGGFANSVSLNAVNFPGVSTSFSVNPTANSSAFTINVADSVPAAFYWLKVVGTSGSASDYAIVNFQVTPTYPFDMDITPDPIKVTAGDSGSASVVITPHGTLPGDVDLAVISDLADGLTVTFSPSSTQANSSLLISAAGAVPAGNYQFNVAGTGANESATKTVTVSVSSPAPVGPPVAGAQITSLSPAFACAQGTAFALTIHGSGFNSNSVVYWQGTALATQFVSSTTLTASVASAQLANPGIVNIQIKSADVTGSSTNSWQFEVDSRSTSAGGPSFPDPVQSVAAGGVAQYAVTLPSTATNASATCLNLPAGVTCIYSKDNGILSLATTSGTLPGSYQVTVVFTETMQGTPSVLLLIFPLWPMARRRKGQRRGWIWGAAFAFVIAMNLAGCGGGGASSASPSPTPTPTYQVTSSGTVTLTVH